MSNFLSNYKSISKNSDIKARVDVERGRLYVPKEWRGKRIAVNAQGKIIACENGALVNAQGFASVAKASKQERQAIAQAIASAKQ